MWNCSLVSSPALFSVCYSCITNFILLFLANSYLLFIYWILSYFLSSWCFILIWQVKLVKCIVQNIVVDISFNQIGGLCTLCFLEQVGIFWNLILFYILGSGRWTVETSTPYLVDCVILLNVQVLKDSWCNLEKSGLNGCWRTWGWINWLIWSVIIIISFLPM